MKTEEKQLAVSETFLSIQGEGKTSGVLSVFIRLAGCNLMCGGQGTQKDGKLYNNATWRCDTIEVWMKGKKKEHREFVNELIQKFDFISVLRDGAHLVITGGEPLLQQEAIASFLYYLNTAFGINPFTEIETNGTIVPLKDLEVMVDQWNVSPKLSNSGEPHDKRIVKDALKWFVRKEEAQLKFVISGTNSLSEAIAIKNMFDIKNQKVWFMPAASSRKELATIQDFVSKAAILNRVNYSNRLHLELWDKKTGV